MARTEDASKVLDPTMTNADERTPLLEDHHLTKPNGEPREGADGSGLESQPRQEDDAAPIAEEVGTMKLVVTMSSLWLGIFFAAIGSQEPGNLVLTRSSLLTTYPQT